MKILIFDAETNALPTSFDAPVTDVAHWPRIIQLGWLVTDVAGNVLRRQKYLVKPDGWEIPTIPFYSENGFSTENCELEGTPIWVVLDAFRADIADCDHMVAHKIEFDFNIVAAEMMRAWGTHFLSLPYTCTKAAGALLFRVPDTEPNTFRSPSLVELHIHLFGKGFAGNHDGLADAIAAKDCFFEMVKRGNIIIDVPAGEHI